MYFNAGALKPTWFDVYMTFPSSQEGNLDPVKFNLQGFDKGGSEPAVKCVIFTALCLIFTALCLHQFLFNFTSILVQFAIQGWMILLDMTLFFFLYSEWKHARHVFVSNNRLIKYTPELQRADISTALRGRGKLFKQWIKGYSVFFIMTHIKR